MKWEKYFVRDYKDIDIQRQKNKTQLIKIKTEIGILDKQFEALINSKSLDKKRYSELIKKLHDNKAELQNLENFFTNLANKVGRSLIFGTLIFIMLIIIPIIYIFTLVFSEFGLEIKNDYYQILATIMPVFLVALYIDSNVKTHQGLKLLNFGLKADTVVVISTGLLVCLYAIAFSTSNGFIFISATLSLFYTLISVVKTIYEK